MTELIAYISRGLVEDPDAVEARLLDGDQDGREVIELQVADSDRGKVIGKRGRMAHCLRTLLAAAAPDLPPVLEIVD